MSKTAFGQRPFVIHCQEGNQSTFNTKEPDDCTPAQINSWIKKLQR